MARTNTQPRVEVDSLTAEVMEYQSVKSQVDELSARQKQLRDSIMEVIEILGDPDEDGHIWLELDHEVNGTTRLQRRRRVTTVFNDERAQDILEKEGLLERCTEMVRVVDEDAVMAALYEGLLTDEQVDAMADHKVVWALHLK